MIVFEFVVLEGHCYQEKDRNKCAEEENKEHVLWFKGEHVRASEMDREGDYSPPHWPWTRTQVPLTNFECIIPSHTGIVLASERLCRMHKINRAEQGWT